MSRPWDSLWTAARCHKLARIVHKLSEMDGPLPRVRPCADPFGRQGVVVEYPPYFTRQLELYLAPGGYATIIRRDGAADMRPVEPRTRWVDALREGIRWLKGAENPEGDGEGGIPW